MWGWQRKKREKGDSERGAVLLSVLLLVVLMSTLAISLMDDIRLAIFRSHAIESNRQAHFYAFGAEEFILQALAESRTASPFKTVLPDSWREEGIAFPIDKGMIRGWVSDRGNCFNVNDVVSRTPSGVLVADNAGINAFARLLEAYGIASSRAELMAESLADWIDSDQTVTGAGAEDAYYQSLPEHYTTPGAWMTDTRELLLVRGFDRETLSELSPVLCALPISVERKLNINTLTRDQAGLMVYALEGLIDKGTAESLIAQRPTRGFSDLTAFWSQPAFEDVSLTDEIKARFSETTTYFGLRTEVTYNAATMVTRVLVRQESEERISLLWRQSGAPS